MVFLFQGQNQGARTTTLATRKEREAAATVLFHPDFNRRLRNRTESADPSSSVSPSQKALADLGYSPLPPVGTFTPPREHRPDMDNLPEIMAKGCPAGKDLWHGEPACPMCLSRIRDRPRPAKLRQAKVNDWFMHKSDSDLFSNS
jgi:hypothetical protein